MSPAAAKLRECPAVGWEDDTFKDIADYVFGRSDGSAVVKFVRDNINGHLYYNGLSDKGGGPATTPDLRTALETYFKSIGVVAPAGLREIHVPQSL